MLFNDDLPFCCLLLIEIFILTSCYVVPCINRALVWSRKKLVWKELV